MAVIYEGATEETRQVVHHHAVLRRGLERRSGALCEAVASGVPFEPLMTTLREYMADQVLPHAKAEERTLYQAAAAQARGSELVSALTAEHHALAYLAGRLRPGTGGTEPRTGPAAGNVLTALAVPALLSPDGEVIMYPDNALSAWQLAVMAVVVVASLAVWLILVLLARRCGS